MELESAILESPSFSAAAEKMGLTVRQLLAKLADDETRKALDDSTRAMYHESMRQLYLGAGRAIGVLERASQGEEISKVQFEAARALLAAAEKAREYFSMELRLTDIEKQLHIV